LTLCGRVPILRNVPTITFDTLKLVHRLKESGMPEAQAEAVAEAFREASGEAELATKRDIERLELRMEGELRLVKSMVGATFAGVVALILKSFF
jgi:hypothetical protein